MNSAQFIDLSSAQTFDSDCSCNRNDFKAWKYTKSLNSTLMLLGEFAHKTEAIKRNGYNSYHPAGTNYWSEDASISIFFYPYHECDIYQCKQCESLFLHYIEHGGHGSEKRLRWVNPDLVTDHNP